MVQKITIKTSYCVQKIAYLWKRYYAAKGYNEKLILCAKDCLFLQTKLWCKRLRWKLHTVCKKLHTYANEITVKKITIKPWYRVQKIAYLCKRNYKAKYYDENLILCAKDCPFTQTKLWCKRLRWRPHIVCKRLGIYANEIMVQKIMIKTSYCVQKIAHLRKRNYGAKDNDENLVLCTKDCAFLQTKLLWKILR